MFSSVYSASLNGINSQLILCEVDISQGLPRCTVVGLPDAAVHEATERVWAALKNSGYACPASRVRINLAPGDIRKEGPRFDLAIALALLASTSNVSYFAERLKDWLTLGELAMDGKLRPVKGVLSALIMAKKSGIKNVLLPAENKYEGALIKGLNCFAVTDLQQAWQCILGEEESLNLAKIDENTVLTNPKLETNSDFAYVCGQVIAKKALEICAAGSHHLLMLGSPGSGKTMLARCLPSIMPRLSDKEAIETAMIRNSVGQGVSALSYCPPFRQPSSNISLAGLMGSFEPGEITLAHRGVLFLDEFLEFKRDCLEALRSPLESGWAEIARAKLHLRYPCRFVLIAAMNPCPCGYWGDMQRECKCTQYQRRRYLARLSGPLLDRIDLHLHINRPNSEEILQEELAESSQDIAQRVEMAVAIQRKRGERNGFLNSEQTRKFCQLDRESKCFLQKLIDHSAISGRVKDRLCRVARTIADLEGREKICLNDICEASEYRALDKFSITV